MARTRPTLAISESERRRLDDFADLQSLPRALGAPPVSGLIRSVPEDFRVTEVLPFTPDGEGEHLYLQIRKRGQNTRWVAQQLARVLRCHPRTIGYAGLKDRHAVAEQWFSVALPGKPDPDPASLCMPDTDVLTMVRHTCKLRRGMLAGNRFVIRVRDLRGDQDALVVRLEALRAESVPNFFGAQRFGRDRGNLRLLAGSAGARPGIDRAARSFGLSALRSALFNGYLALRLHAGTWQQPLPGEILYCPTTRRYRLNDGAHRDDVDQGAPSGLLWGTGANQASDDALRLETDFFAEFPGAMELIASLAPRMVRRPLGIGLDELGWDFVSQGVDISFALGRGQFATAALREMVDISDRAAA